MEHAAAVLSVAGGGIATQCLAWRVVLTAIVSPITAGVFEEGHQDGWRFAVMTMKDDAAPLPENGGHPRLLAIRKHGQVIFPSVEDETHTAPVAGDRLLIFGRTAARRGGGLRLPPPQENGRGHAAPLFDDASRSGRSRHAAWTPHILRPYLLRYRRED
jgi:hypothetical protein